MNDGFSFWAILMFIALVALDAILYGFDAAVQYINMNYLEQQAGAGSERAKRLRSVIEESLRLNREIQIVSNVVGISTGIFIFDHLQLFTSSLLDQVGVGNNQWISAVSVLLVGLILLIILISFGIVIPRQYAAKYPIRWSYAVLPIVIGLNAILRPLVWLITTLSALMLNLLGIDLKGFTDDVTEEIIKTMVNESHEQGILEASEAEMITNIVDLDTKEASDIMTHRKNLIAINAELTLTEALDFIITEGSKSRYPVYHVDHDDIVGILHMKDAVIFAKQRENESKNLDQIPGLLRPVYFIPETRNIHTLFKEMQSKKIQMEVVVDEYGQTVGIVTMEDILEEIVGSISDEYDEEENYITGSEDGGYLIQGCTPLEEVEKTLNIAFSHEEYDTLNGFLISLLGRIPEEGENSELRYQDYNFKISRVQNKMIDLVLAKKVAQEN